jgi:Zn-dependent peptidase ImmA (M78 family)
VADLKRRWQVSLAALLMRAKNLERMSDAAYLTGVKAISARGWRRLEPVPLGAPEAPAHLRRLATMDSRLRGALPQEVVQAVLGANAA